MAQAAETDDASPAVPAVHEGPEAPVEKPEAERATDDHSVDESRVEERAAEEPTALKPVVRQEVTGEAPAPNTFTLTLSAWPKGTRYFIGPAETPEGYIEAPFLPRLEAEEYAELCTAPCQKNLPLGDYSIALAAPGEEPIRAREVLKFRGAAVMEGAYQSKE